MLILDASPKPPNIFNDNDSLKDKLLPVNPQMMQIACTCFALVHQRKRSASVAFLYIHIKGRWDKWENRWTMISVTQQVTFPKSNRKQYNRNNGYKETTATSTNVSHILLCKEKRSHELFSLNCFIYFCFEPR